ncbi:MAG: LamG-like jellyroll fold domain-containing protein, partial [Caldilineaceae bacterium]
MRQHHHRRRAAWALALGLLCLLGWSTVDASLPDTPLQQLQSAWTTAGQIGQVTYRTVTIQTIYPTERLENVGRRAHTRRMEISGTLDRPGEAALMQMRSGPQANQQVMDLKLEGGLAYGRTAVDAEWQPMDGVTDFFAPGGDLLGYLAAAKNVQEMTPPQPSPLRGGSSNGTSLDSSTNSATTFLPNGISVPSPEWGGLGRGWSFDLDGPAYARYLRDQSQRTLQQKGMPANLRMDVNQVYVRMQGQGELWLDADGLPRRQTVHLRFPPKQGDSEWVEAEIVTDFSAWGNGTQRLEIGSVGDWISAANLPISNLLIPQSLNLSRKLGLSLAVLLSLLAFAGLAIHYRRSKRFYMALGGAVIVALLTGPLAQAAQTVGFLDRQKVAEERSVGGDAATEYAIHNTEFDPRRAPLDRTNLPSPVSIESLSNACTDAAAIDSDGDGLNDDVECQELGTYPDDPDTDNDGISDGAEVLGYPRANPSWWLNPRNPDSNGDGILDGVECPELADILYGEVDSSFVYATCVDTDSDGAADVWDYDNDGDGVPDQVDSSPFAYFGNRTTGVDDHTLDFNLTFTDTTGTRPVFVDFELRPTDDRHLWYSNNVLDWPSNDTQGQHQRIDDSTFTDLGYSGSTASNGDTMLIPMLEFEITYDAANPAAGLPISGTVANTSAAIPDYSDLSWLDTDLLQEYGVIVNNGEDDQTLLLWLPLTLLQDDVGDMPVAWQGRMVYYPQASNLGANQQLRVLWLVNAIANVCDTSGMGEDDEYDIWCASGSDHWTTTTNTLQTYYEDFFVSGLIVTEDHGGSLGIVAQKPGTGDAYYEDALWHAADALHHTFLRGQLKSDSSRFTPLDLSDYLPASTLYVEEILLAQAADLATVSTVTSTQVLNSVFGSSASVGDQINLLFVGELSKRSVSLGESAVSTSGNLLHPSLAESVLDTSGIVRWTAYEYLGSAVWDTADLNSYRSALEANLTAGLTTQALTTALGGITSSDESRVRDGIVALAWNYYLSLQVGANALLAVDNTAVSTETVAISRFAYTPGSDDDALATIIHGLLTNIQSFYARNIYSVSASGQLVTMGGLAWEELGESIEAVATALGDKAAGVSSSSTEALQALEGYYKTVDVEDFDLIAPGAISLSALDNFAIGIVITYGVLKSILGLSSMYTGLWLMTASTEAVESFFSVLQNSSSLVLKIELVKYNQAVWAVAGLILSVGIALYTFFSANPDNAFERSNTEAYLVAQIIYALIIFAITLIPGVGFLITGLIALADGIMIAVCKALGKDPTTETNRWWCNGASQAITLAIYYAIHDYTPLAVLDRDGRVDVEMNTPIYAQHMTDGGFIVGNDISIGAVITSSLYMNSPTSWMGDVYAWQLSDSNLRESTFDYRFQQSKKDVSVGLSQSTWQPTPGRDESSSDGERFFKSETFSDDFPLEEAGINRPFTVYFSEGFAMNAQECWTAYLPVPPYVTPVCYLETYKDTLHQDMGTDFVFDIFPSSISGLMDLYDLGKGSYRLAWDSQFPVLADADGDGLRSKAKGGVDPNDSSGDTDLDGLSDYWEYANGYDPSDSDPDQDGLTDYWEAFYGTNPFAADSDSDGLGDAEEVFHPNISYPFENSHYTDTSPPLHASSQAAWMGGWDVVYDWDNGTPLSTWVSSDPNDLDSDDDAILDGREKIYGYNPWVAGTANLLSMRSSLQTATDSLPYVAAGGTITYTAVITNELENRYATGLLQAEFPTDDVQKTTVINTVGPLETVSLAGTVAVNQSSSQPVSMTVRAGVEFEIATERIVWLRMDEESGATTFSDSTFREHHATCSGVPCPAANGSYLTFSYNSGNEDVITLTEDDDFDLSSFSAGAWVKTTSASGQSTIFNDANDLRLWINSGQVRVTQDGTTYNTGSVISSNEWTHVMVTFDAASGAGVIYVDGVAAKTYTGSVISRNNSGISLAGLFGGTLYLDEFELYNRALSATEVQNLVNADPVLLAEVSSSDFEDSSPWGNSLSCSGAACPSVDTGSRRVNFDQTEYYAVSGSSLNLNGGGFTYATWLRPTSRGVKFDSSGKTDSQKGSNEHDFSLYLPDTNTSRDWQGIAGDNSLSNGNSQYPSLWVESGGRVHIRFQNGSTACSYTTGSGLIKYNKWQQLVVGFNGSGFNVYINGELKASSGNVCNTTPPSKSSLYIGRPNNHGYVYVDDLVHTKAYDGEYWDWGCGLTGCLKVDRKDENKLDVDGKRLWSATTEGEKLYDISAGRIIDDGNAKLKFFDSDASPNSDDVRINQTINSRSLREYDGTLYGWKNTGGNNYLCDSEKSCGELYWSLSNDFYEGYLEDFRIYDYNLSAGQVQDLYDATFATLRFSFDEPPGKSVLEDESGNGLDLGCVSTANTCPDTGIPGRDNQALRFDGGVADDDGFDGAADYLSVADDNRLDVESDTTITLWVKADDWNNNRYTPFLVKGSGSNANYYLGKSSNNRLVFAYRDSGNTWREQTLLLSGYDTSGWLHIAAVIEPDTSTTAVTLYVNGTANGPYTLSGTPKPNGNALTVGRYLGSNHAAFDGLIDELVMLPFALDATEVAALVNAAPLLNLHLDEDTSDGGFLDDSPAANHLTCASDATCPAGGDKGQIREAALFDGMDKLTDSANSESRLSQFSIGLWVKPQDETGAAQYLIERGNGSRHNYRLWMAANSFKVTFDLYSSACNTLYSVTTSSPLVEDQWNHIFATYDGNAMRLYLNGSQNANKSTGNRGACTSSSHSLTIGENFAGNLDEIVLYGTALEGEEIAAAYAYQSVWYDVAEQHNLIVDADSPTVYLDLATTAISATVQTMAVYAHDPTSWIASVEYNIDGGGWTTINTSDNSWTFNYTAISEGSHTVQVRATDAVGNSATSSHAILVDATPPTLTIESSLTAAILGVGESLPISGTVSDSGSGIDSSTLTARLEDRQGLLYYPDAPTVSGSGWSASQSFANAPPYGVYTLTASVADVAGNSTTVAAPLQLDGLAPVADVLHASATISGSNSLITGTVADIPLPVQSKRLHLH